MHPSESIKGEKSDVLKNRKIALCVTGSIAAVESVKLARELIRHGAEIYPYVTHSALKFVGKDALLFATGKEPIIELTGKDEHLYDFDTILVAPATADIISKAACGIADDAVSTLIFANLEKCVFVPSMDSRMYKSEILRENMEKLKKFAMFIEPKMEEDKAKLPSNDLIVAKVMNHIRKDLKGKNVLVIGGAGYEKFDEFRIITNLATGKIGVEIARFAYYYGANVKLLIGLHSVDIPEYIEYEEFGGINTLMQKIDSMKDYDAIIVPAALPDFKPKKRRGKVKSLSDFNEIRFEENPKFLKRLREEYNGFLIGFKAESGISKEELIRRAKERMEEYNLDMIIANLIEDVDRDSTKAIIIFSDGEFEEFSGKKEGLAKRIVEIMAESL